MSQHSLQQPPESANVRLVHISAVWPCSHVRKDYTKTGTLLQIGFQFLGNPLQWQAVNQTVPEGNIFSPKWRKGQASAVLIWDRAGSRTGKLGVESHQPCTTRLCRERARVRAVPEGQAQERKRQKGQLCFSRRPGAFLAECLW